MTSRLWVCWRKPPKAPPERATILSFMSATEEHDLAASGKYRVVSARTVLPKSRRLEACDTYRDIVARIGVTEWRGRTLRSLMAPSGEASLWWYHRVSFRDCESDPAFDWILAVFAIRDVAQTEGARELTLVGAPAAIAKALHSAFSITVIQLQSSRRSLVRAILSRALFAVRMLRQVHVCRRLPQPEGQIDVALASFWDWSISYDARGESLVDRYYRDVPDELQRNGLARLWLAWLDPAAEPGKEGRALRSVLAPLRDTDDVVLLQHFLSPADVVRTCLDLRPAFTFLRARRAMRRILQRDGIDWYTLLSRQLSYGFLDSNIPYARLIAIATERAAKRYRPRLTFAFLEHFPSSRAFYEGVHQADWSTVRCIVQHASYCHEKTFLRLDPVIEFDGKPDGHAVPHADIVCAMGRLGKRLFEECGYAPDDVVLTGSPRYDGITLRPAGSTSKPASIRLLMVSSLSLDVELEMAESVSAAARGVDRIELTFRNHPFLRIERDSRFEAFRDRVRITSGSLADDLAAADLILFSYSTVGEEALLQGKPVWQWVPRGFNGSALAEVLPIQRFSSIADLRHALRRFVEDPKPFLPTSADQHTALEELFFQSRGATDRVVGLARHVLKEDGLRTALRMSGTE